MLNLYKDSREFPLYNYKRIVQTGDFLYMVKGYDGEPIPNANLQELSAKHQEVVQDYVVTLNNANADIADLGLLNRCRINIESYLYIINIIEMQMKINDLRDKLGLPHEESVVPILLDGIKVPIKADLKEQALVIKDKIEKLQNDIKEATTRLEANKPDEGVEEADIDEVIITVALALEHNIDERKTSLYQFGLLQKQALAKIEQIAKANQKK